MDMFHAQLQLSTSGELRMLVGQIRGYLSSRDQTGDESVRELWRRYIDACRQINQRLDLCAQLLERGEWIEALRSAELEPDLFDCIAALDFPKRSEWEQMGVDLGWERLIPVSPSISERLQAAWENRKRLRPLLREHMRLAVSRAPLKERLRVMQQLAERDRMSTFWREDIQTLERARGPQLIRQLQQAIREAEIDCLQSCLAEIRETPWTLKHPPVLRKLEQEAEVLVLDQKVLPDLMEKIRSLMKTQDQATVATVFETWVLQLQTLDQLVSVRPDHTQRLIRENVQLLDWAERACLRHKAAEEWTQAAQDLIEACGDPGLSYRELRRLWLQLNRLGIQVHGTARKDSLVRQSESAFFERRRQWLSHVVVNVTMILAGVLVPAALIAIYFRWIFS